MKPPAYEGNLPYIFASYSHKDMEKVFEVLDELRQKGYRIWYDEGITPGSEWPEEVASHLYHSAMLMAFVSNNSMQSENCRREINFALSKNKPFLSIILEETALPLGIEMQLSSQQNIIRHNFATWEGFIQKILACPHLAPCIGDTDAVGQSERFDHSDQTSSPESDAEMQNLLRRSLVNADAFHREGKYHQELEALQTAQRILPDNANLLIKIGRVHRLLEDNQKAMEFYEKAKEIDPGIPTIYTNMATIYTVSGEYDKAKPLYEKALNLFFSSPSPELSDLAICYGNYALCIGKLGDIKGAKKYLIKARDNGYSKENTNTICEMLDISPKFLAKRFILR